MFVSTLAGEDVASTWFRDGAVTVYDQCGNDDGDGYSTGDTGCRWEQGNLVSSKATYYEGDATVQRAAFSGFATGTPHTVTIKYGTTKAGKHAYDFLTNWDWSEDWITLADLCQGITNCTGSSVASTTFAIPQDTNAGGKDSAVRNITMRGGTITGISAPALVSGSYAGDGETAITVTFTVDSVDDANDMCTTTKVQGKDVTTCSVALFFGAHISDSADWAPEPTAKDIPGSPYHVSLDALDGGSIGERDNQLQSAAVLGPQNATLTLQKTVVNDNGGNALDTAWTLNASGPTPISGVEGDSAVTSAVVTPGTYTLTETNGPSGYAPTNLSCSGATLNGNQITLVAGDVATCTFTNDDVAPTLTLVKTVTNNNGGTAVANDFQGKIDGNNVAWGVAQAVSAGAHTASETNLPGYTASAWGGNCASDGSVTLALGENKTCTITNDDQQAYIIVNKTVVNDNGGTAVANNFNLKVDGNAVQDEVAYAVNPGVHTASETNLPGYTAGVWGGDCDAQGSVTVVLGQTKTCTITNNDDAPSLTLVKEVTNDNGGTAKPEDWDLVADGYDAQSPDAGTYNLSESGGPDGYLRTSLTCDNAVGQVTSVTLGLGEDVTCTFVNDDIAPKLHLRKVVVNDNGGDAVLGDFTLSANGIGDNDLSGTSPVDSGGTLKADTFTLSESTDVEGYSASDWVCVGGEQDGAEITLGIGEEATCTITNDDQPAKITLIKNVITDNGGIAGEDDFGLSAGGVAFNSGETKEFSANTPIAINEVGLFGYAFVDITGDEKCPEALGGTVTLDEGEEITCTITNDDIQPKLKLVKTVDNNYGGTATADTFQGSVSGTDVDWDTFVGFNAGSYTADETDLPGYEASAWGGDCAENGSVTLSVGEEKTCTITNSDIAPQLTVIKHVINDNGGLAVAGDFTMNVTGTEVSSPSFPGAEAPGTTVTLDAGNYSVDEVNLPGYIKTLGQDCSGTIGIGETKTCTITNNDTPGHFTGGGSVFPTLTQGAFLSGVNFKNTKDTRVTHGFTLHCDASRDPNRLQVNWGPVKNEQKFHLLTLTTATCTDNPNIDPQQPNADFDTIEGTGTGRFNNVDGVNVWFRFDDAGEPGKNDRVWMKIWKDATVYLNTGSQDISEGLKLNVGNQQAHQDN